MQWGWQQYDNTNTDTFILNNDESMTTVWQHQHQRFYSQQRQNKNNDIDQ
jgi:hypothetical protein